MTVSAGNLDSLLGNVFSSTLIQGLTIQTITNTGTPPSFVGLTGASTGTESDFASGDTTTITGVNDAANSISVSFTSQGVPAGNGQFFVSGYSADSLLVSKLASLSQLSAQDVATAGLPGSLVATISTSALGAGTPLSYGAGGTFTGMLLCFARGTRIATPDGEVAVEHLAVGDTIAARFAGAAAISWIGHRRIDCAKHPEPRKVWPVRIAAGAFASSQPRRDLWLSPDHCVFVDGVLVPIKHLVNGSTIAQVPVDAVNYYHLELEDHDVVLADGLPAESLVPDSDRSFFENGGMAVQLHPDFHGLAWEGDGCAPLIVTGPALEMMQRRLGERALAHEPALAATG